MKRFLAIGECMVEFADCGDGRFVRGFAGDTFNTAWYARKLLPPEFSVDYLSAVGDDPQSDDLLAFIKASGAGVSHVRRIPGKSPGLYVISLRNGERSFSYWRDTSAARDLAADMSVVRAACDAADVIFVSGITLAILPPADADNLLAHLASCRGQGKFVAFDPNHRPRLWRGSERAQALALKAAAAASIVLTGCDDEDILFGTRDMDEIAARYLGASAEQVVIKDGGRGAVIATPAARIPIAPVPPVALVDTTAAGDSFNAAYLAGVMQGRAPAAAGADAARVAAQVIAHPGALVAINS
jgi:2-dehydro-3-deoxygluconokinase